MTTALSIALKTAADSKKVEKVEKVKTAAKAPLVTLKLGDWIKGPMVQALRSKYAMDAEAGQRGADYLVSSGMVKIPTDARLQCVGIRRFGGALGFVVSAENDIRNKVTIEGLPD